MSGFLSFLAVAWSVALFALTRVVPALFNIGMAMLTWAFTFISAHQAAILAALSWAVSTALAVDSRLLSVAHAAVAYFSTSAVAGFLAAVKGEAEVAIADVCVVVEDEVAWVITAFRGFFPAPAPTPAPPEPTGTIVRPPDFVPPKSSS